MLLFRDVYPCISVLGLVVQSACPGLTYPGVIVSWECHLCHGSIICISAVSPGLPFATDRAKQNIFPLTSPNWQLVVVYFVLWHLSFRDSFDYSRGLAKYKSTGNESAVSPTSLARFIRPGSMHLRRQ